MLDARGETIGVATNNVAEYRALVAGLEKAVELGVDELEVVSDSELLVKQMRGEYRVKNEALRDLNEEANALERRLGNEPDELVAPGVQFGVRYGAGCSSVSICARCSLPE